MICGAKELGTPCLEPAVLRGLSPFDKTGAASETLNRYSGKAGRDSIESSESFAQWIVMAFFAGQRLPIR